MHWTKHLNHVYHPYTHSPQPHLPRTPHQHRRHTRTLTVSQHTHMQHKQQYMHHNHRTHNIGYHNLTGRPMTTTGLQTPHKHTDPTGWWTKSGMIGLPPQTRFQGVGRQLQQWTHRTFTQTDFQYSKYSFKLCKAQRCVVTILQLLQKDN